MIAPEGEGVEPPPCRGGLSRCDSGRERQTEGQGEWETELRGEVTCMLVKQILAVSLSPALPVNLFSGACAGVVIAPG